MYLCETVDRRTRLGVCAQLVPVVLLLELLHLTLQQQQLLVGDA